MEIRNLKDWCTALDSSSDQVKKYEQQLVAFYKNVKLKPDYATPFYSGFYKKESFPKVILRNSPKIGLITIIATLVIFGLMWLITQKMLFGIIFGILTFLVFAGAQIGIKFLLYKYQVNNLSKMEESLTGILGTVPSNYRASDKMKFIARVYFERPSIDPSIILECVDDCIQAYGRTSPVHSIMFDIPSNCPFLNVNEEDMPVIDTVIDTENPAKKKSPFLPADIDTKIFEGSKDSDKDLHAMIGLNDVKDQIQKFRNRISFYGNNSNNGCHMAFLGSAGTGKTTVARIITKMLYDLGYIKKNQYIEISGDYLCAGDTSRASAIIEYAYDGVLFIDEAYLMYRTGSEVIGVLLKAMEDHRKDFVCILAGYEEQMTKLFASNEGFNSRIKHSIYFSDYDVNEMLDIFNYFIKDYNGSSYSLDDNAKQALLDVFSLEKKSKSFGNARTVRNAVDAIMDYYADRSIREKSNTHKIMLEDIQLFAEDRRRALQHELKNASAANQLDEQIIRLSELKSRMKNGSNDPDKDLSMLIGLETFKNEVDILRSQKEFYGHAVHQKILFIGNDGCGKSTLASILTGYLYNLGYIQENKYLEIPAELLKGSYVGHTAKRAEAIISYASGGVIYIKNYNGLVSSNDSFAGEALSAISTAINENTDVTIILADYESDTINLMRNMFTLVYEFPTYSNEQLLQIFDIQAMKQNFVVDDEARQILYNYIISQHLSIRDIQQIYTHTVKNHISNFNGDESTKYVISVNDLVFPQTYNAETLAQNSLDQISQLISNSMNKVSTNNIVSTDTTPKIKLNIKSKV